MAPTGRDYDPHDKNLTDEELSAVLEAVKHHPKYRTLVTLLALRWHAAKESFMFLIPYWKF